MRSPNKILALLTLLTTLTISDFPLIPNLKGKIPNSQVLAQTSDERKAEADRLFNQGNQQYRTSQFEATLQSWEKALTIYREINDRYGEGRSLNNLGSAYQSLGDYAKAIEYHQQSLAIAREIHNRQGEGASLGNLGNAYYSLGDYSQAIEYQQQHLAIAREIKNRLGEGQSLGNLGNAYYSLGDYSQAIEYHQQRLAIAREINDRQGEGKALGNLGVAYQSLGDYAKAIEYHQQHLAITREINDRLGEGTSLGNLGNAYYALGDYSQAIEYHQQHLAITREIKDRLGEGTSLGNLGIAYYSLGDYAKAIEYHQQHLAIAREIKNRLGEGQSLGNLGNAYYLLGDYSQAIEYQQQYLAIAREINDRLGEGRSLGSLGITYYALGDYSKAIEYQQQHLAIAREIGDREAERFTLNSIGVFLERQNQPELAIVFLKQSVNVTESIRKDLRVLPKEQQQSYTETVAVTYRRLADLLLQQDRILEAQRVLDLLKVQELEDYLNNVRGNNNTAQGLPNLPAEQQILTNYQDLLNKAVEIGRELTQLRQLKQQTPLTPTQEQRIAQLVKAQETITDNFNNFTRSPEVLALVTQIAQKSPDTLSQDLLLRMKEFNALQDNLRNLQQQAVLLYPLILDDRIELILTTPDSPPIRRTVPVSKQQLNQTIAAFRSALQDPRSDAKIPAQKLYNWLIKPLEADLKAANAQTIIYAPDAQLRYIPLAALYDGEQWLVQRYRINNITAASLTDLNTRPQPQLKILAGAFATGRYNFTVGGQAFDYSGLSFAGTEVENLAKTVPTTTQLIDQAFSPAATVPNMDDHTVVHLATHAAFVVGTPEDSFILFGNGERMTLRDIERWTLTNVDLVVLSACETGLGGKLGNGEEILSLGYQIERRGARAAIASLWSVSDGGTQALMNAFYSILKQDKMTKAEALRQAQIALITKDLSVVGGLRGEGAWVEVVNAQTGLPPEVSNNLSHPYYWAPFILIGNGL